MNGDESHDTKLLIQLFTGGDDTALEKYYTRYSGKLVRAANDSIRFFGIDTTDFDGEEAVNMAFLELCGARDRHGLEGINDSDGFMKLIKTILERILEKARDRSEAFKRGGRGVARRRSDREGTGAQKGPGARHGYRRRDLDLERLPSTAPSAEETLYAMDELESLLEHFADSADRRVIIMRGHCHTVREIAKAIGLSPSTVLRRLEVIRGRFPGRGNR